MPNITVVENASVRSTVSSVIGVLLVVALCSI